LIEDRRVPLPSDREETPAALGYRMPAEWEPHAATWLSWPHNQESWPGKMEVIPSVWIEVVRALAPGEEVRILVNDNAPARTVKELLDGAGIAQERVFLHEVSTNDAWMRDHGPVFVTRGGDKARSAIVGWRYNAWGGKYPPWEEDDRVPAALAASLDVPIYEPGIVLEGGSIDVNGKGTLLTTEACLLNPNRNPHLDRAGVEEYLRAYLGVRHIVWLGDGIVGDDTDGHVDDLSRFVSPTTIVTVVEAEPSDANHLRLRENLQRLRMARDQDGCPFEIISLPMPEPVYYEGNRLPASYANFYIGNEVVLVPTFRCAADEEALGTLENLFPARRVIGIDAVDLVWGFGAFHCITQQQPAT
jgi:agmatine deiminase